MLKIFPGKAMPFASGGETIHVRQLTLHAGVERDVEPRDLTAYLEDANQRGVQLNPGIDIFQQRLRVCEITPRGNVVLDLSDSRKQTIAESMDLVEGAKAYLGEDTLQAISILEKAIAVWPNNVRAYICLGQAYGISEDYANAKRCFETAVGIYYCDAEIHYGLGIYNHFLGNFEVAVAAFKEAITFDSGLALAWSRLAASYGALGRREEAMRACRKALDIEPNLPDALFALGVMHFERGAYADSREAWKRAIEGQPNLLDEIIGIGVRCMQCHAYEQSWEALQCVLAIKPNHTDALLNIGVLHSIRDENEQARKLFEQLLPMEPNNASLLFNLGTIYLNAEEYERAVELLQRANAAVPNHAIILNSLGRAYVRCKEYAKAKAACDNALQLEPNHADALATLGLVHLELREYEEAAEALHRANTIESGNAVVLTNLGCAYLGLREYGQAKEVLKRAAEINPHDSNTLSHLGNAYSGLHKWEKAKVYCKRAFAIDPDNLDALGVLGNVYAEAGKFEAAKFFYLKALQIKPAWHGVRNSLGEVHAVLGEYPKAIRAFERVKKNDPRSIDAYMGLGRVYQHLGGTENYEKALDVYEKLIEFWPTATAYYNLGEVYLRLEEYEKARDAHRTVAEKEPPDEYNYLKVGILSLAINDLDEAERYLEKAKPMFIDEEEIKTCSAFIHWAKAKKHWDSQEWKAAKKSFRKASAIFDKLPNNEFAEAVKAYEQSLVIERNLNDAIQQDPIEGIFKHVKKAARSARDSRVGVERQNIPLLAAQAYYLEAIGEILLQARRILRGKRIREKRIDQLLESAEKEFKSEDYKPGLEAVDQLKKLRRSIEDLNTGTQLQFKTAVKGMLKLIFTFLGVAVTATGYPGVGVGMSGVDIWRFITRWRSRREDEVIRIIDELDKDAALKELSHPRYASALRRIADPHSGAVRSLRLRSEAKRFLAKLQKRAKRRSRLT